MLVVENVNKSFGGVKALRDISLRVEKGSLIGLIGPNGSGKSTLFNVITGVLSKDTGNITFKGKRIDHLPPHNIAAMGISRTFQVPQISRRMTVLENMLLAPMGQIGDNPIRVFVNWKAWRNQDRTLAERAEEILELVGLIRQSDELAGSLAGGQLKLLSLAVALMNDGELLMLDEPTAGVDLALTDQIMGYLIQAHGQGKTLLIVEHRMRVISGICQYVYVLDAGEVIARGEPSEIQNNPQVIEAYLGSKKKVKV